MRKTYFKYITALLLFGSNGIVASHIHLASYHIVLLRTLIGSIFLILLFYITKKRISFHKQPKDCVFICVSGIAMGASWMFLYEAYDQMGVSVSSLLYYCGPVIVMVLSPMLFKEKFSIAKLISFFVVFIGVFLVNGQTSNELNVWGIACGCLSAIMYSVMVMANKKSKNITGIENSLIQMLISFLTVVIFVGIKENGYLIQIQAMDWLWICILGIFNTGIGCYCYFSSISELSVQTVAVCGCLELLSAVCFSVIFLNETMTTLQIVGAFLIIGGVIFGENFKKSKIQ